MGCRLTIVMYLLPERGRQMHLCMYSSKALCHGRLHHCKPHMSPVCSWTLSAMQGLQQSTHWRPAAPRKAPCRGSSPSCKTGSGVARCTSPLHPVTSVEEPQM